VLLAGLNQLEYRGYDSAGLAVVQDDRIEVRKEAGKLAGLVELVVRAPLKGAPGIGHTRWATHGAPTSVNAHPHVGASGRVVVVQNGIVENYLELKQELQAQGVRFVSDTDTETIVHLVEQYLAEGLGFVEAARATFRRLHGANVLVLMAADAPDTLVAARIGNAGGLVVGLGAGENFLASDASALLSHTREVLFLDAGQMVVLTAQAATVTTLEGSTLTPRVQTLDWDEQATEKGAYRHFMHKEIHEQPQVLRATLAGRVDFTTGRISLPELRLTESACGHPSQEIACSIDRIVITGCGTAAYAGMLGKILIENIARIPVEVVGASELRHGDPVLNRRTVVLAISQSGETVDTLGAMEKARAQGALVWAIVNAPGSQALRIADGHVAMRCGPEIGVASTKAFAAPVLDLYLLAVLLADLRGVLDTAQREALVADLHLVPALVEQALAREADVATVAQALRDMTNCLYVGRGCNWPVALEGALKLKELAYVHAEGCAAGELKHGPIALVDARMPVVCLATRDPWRDKMLSQIQQVRARQGRVVAVATDGDTQVAAMADHVLWVPEAPWRLAAVVTVLPLQLLAYHSALLLGRDVDQPRNLAKSVTVE
jgi:glucosamine--fructose-6-phosphate aminotransferase (isomerizing)